MTSILQKLKGASPAEGGRGRVVKGGEGYRAQQGSDYLPGISAESVGAKTLWLGIVTLPPGQRTKAHVHERHETAFYMMSGDEVELWTGDQLQYRDVVRTGDYLSSQRTYSTLPSTGVRNQRFSLVHAVNPRLKRAS